MAVLDSAELSTQSPYSRRWLADVVFALDARLQRRHAVFEYTRNPACVFRLAIARAPHSLALRDGTRVRSGQRIACLHFWNEQVPAVPKSGPTIAWARQMRCALAISLQELARYFTSRPDLGDIVLVSGDVPSGTAAEREQLARIMERFGFEAVVEPENLPLRDRLRRFADNMLISLIVLAQNAGTLRSDTLRRGRLPIRLSRRILEREFGGDPAPDRKVAGA